MLYLFQPPPIYSSFIDVFSLITIKITAAYLLQLIELHVHAYKKLQYKPRKPFCKRLYYPHNHRMATYLRHIKHESNVLLSRSNSNI